MDPTSSRFEWDRTKHGIAFEEAMTVFTDRLALVFDDPDHSQEEDRGIIIGYSQKRRLLVVCFTERDERIRIVGARRVTLSERRDYEEGTS
jgi:uncharacterized DUF497 family protein